MHSSRRDFGKLALASLPAVAALASNPARLFAATKPNSKINGVQVGVISYSYRQMPQNGALDDLRYAVENGINGLELETVQEEWAGAPKRPAMRRPPAGGPRQASPEMQAAMKQYAEDLKKFRLSVPMSKYEELRKIYADAGCFIYAFKITLNMEMEDAEFDYAFKAAKACGASHLTMEMPDGKPELTKRIGEFGAKYKMMMGYHAHTQALPTTWDEAMAQSPWNGINLDIGHYTAAGNTDTIEFIKKNHARITSMHIKDRKNKEHGEANMPFGEGDTPIKEVLQLMKKEGYKFPATIELEYPIPTGSDPVKEVAKCYSYIKAALA